MEDNGIEELKYFVKLLMMPLFALLFFIILTGYVIYDWTQQLLDTLYYPLFSSFVVLLCLVLLIVNTKSINIRNIRYLVSAIFSLFLITFLQIFDWETANNHTPFQRPTGHVFLHIADFFIPVMILSVYLHFESISRVTYNPTMMILLGLLIFPYFPLTLLTILFNNDEANTLLYDFLPFFAFASLAIVIYSIRVLIKLFISTVDRDIKRSSSVMISGLMFLVFSFVTQVITPDYINLGFFKAVIFQLMILMLGMILLATSYIGNPVFLYASPYKIYSMIIYDKRGDLVWSKSFDPVANHDQDTKLQAEILSTIQTLLREVSGFVGNIRQVEFVQQGRVLIETIDKYTLVIMSKNLSRQIQIASRQFSDFQETSLSNGMISQDNIDRGLELYFPYVLMYQ